MHTPFKLLDTIQAEWPLLSSIALVGLVAAPPWALRTARRHLARLTPGELAVCRRQLPALVQQLAILHQRWVVTAVLAVLLALTIVAQGGGVPLQSAHMGALVSVLAAVLLPPLVICNGITRDYVAARALIAALHG